MPIKKRWQKIIEIDSIGAGATSRLEDCNKIDLSKAEHCAITVRLKFNPGATNGARVHLVSSPDGSIFDTQDYTYFDIAVSAGNEVQKTVAVTPDVLYLKAKIENLDSTVSITDIDAWVIIGEEE